MDSGYCITSPLGQSTCSNVCDAVERGGKEEEEEVDNGIDSQQYLRHA